MRHTRTTGIVLTGGVMLFTLAFAAMPLAAEAEQASSDKPISVTIYPILIKAPIFGASVDLPIVPGGGGGGGEGAELSESTDLSLNAAYMGGVLIEANRWFAEAAGTWAAVSASRDAPRIRVDSNTYFYTARAGVRLLGGLSATAGVRRATVDLDASLTLPGSGRTIEGRTKPGIWDPLIGADWRRPLGSLRFEANVQGGGFGVGADVDVSAEARARWRIVKHFELCLGYSLNYFKLTVADVSIGSFQRTLTVRQTLHGPEIGLGIAF